MSEPAIRITDGLGHDLPASTAHALREAIIWLDLEEAAGDLSPGLAEWRDMLRAQEADDE